MPEVYPTLPHRRIFVLLTAAVLLMAAGQAKTLKVNLVMSDSSPPYRQFAASFNNALAASNADVNIVESAVIGTTHADLIVAVGTHAAELAVTQADTPVLAVMVSRMSYEGVLAHISPPKSPVMISAIYLDQPLIRRIDFLRTALPERRRIGLLYSPEAHVDIEDLRRTVVARDGSLIARRVRSTDELFERLENVLENSDVLLAIPDSMIYNSSNILNILLTSYRHSVPLIGISQAYVNAGAVGAIFSTPEQLAQQTRATVISFAQTGKLPKPQDPLAFTIAVNQQVARSLGIALPPPEAIRSQMDQAQTDKTRGAAP